MAYQLRPYQLDLISRIGQSWFDHGNRRVMAQLPTGGGKCLGKDTPIRMFNGSVKLVQDIIVGDLLMGADSTPRTVLSLARGVESMYRVAPVKGDTWECNESHILSLVWNGDESRNRKRGDIVNISVRDYLALSKTQKHCLKQYRVGVEYQSQPITIDPYYLGAWLGDGSKSRASLTSMDREVVDAMYGYAHSVGLKERLECKPDNKAKTYFHVNKYRNLVKGEKPQCNPINHMLRDLGVLNNKHIPMSYLTNTRHIRLQLLAGLLDTDGYLHHGHFEITQKLSILADGILTLARGLGFAAYRADKIVNGVTYHRITISGDVSQIPCKVARRVANKRLQKKDVLRTGFSIEPIGLGDYYGFEIDGDRLFLLGDYTVTHNSVVLASIIRDFSNRNLKVLVLAHRQELVNQLVEKVESIVDEPVGVIMAGVKPNYDRDIQVGSVQSMARRLESCPHLDLIVIDEAHHSCSTSYRKITDRYQNAKVLGVTATPIRLDGKGFRDVFDDLVCGVTVTELIEMGSLSPYKYYAGERTMSTAGIKKLGGDFKVSELEAENPVEIVANQVIEAQKRHLAGKQSVIFAVSVAHSIAIAEALNSVGIITHHLDGMTDNSERKITMQLFRDKKIQCLTNCALFDEGLDIPSLDGVILARPTASLSRYLQMAGRALRVAEGKEHAIIIDLAGNYERLGMPIDERIWTLDGVEKKKRDKKSNTKRKRNDITGEIETVSIFDTGTEFIEIGGKTVVMNAVLKHWIDLCDAIIAEGVEKGYKAGWAAHRMMASDTQPPLDAWKYLGQKLGYNPSWAKYKVEEWLKR